VEAETVSDDERNDECLTAPNHDPRRWQARRFEQSCGKIWRWDERQIDGKRESRRVFVRRA
jgi:hypothetical protein